MVAGDDDDAPAVVPDTKLIPLSLDLEGVRRGETRTEDERGLERRG